MYRWRAKFNSNRPSVVLALLTLLGSNLILFHRIVYLQPNPRNKAAVAKNQTDTSISKTSLLLPVRGIMNPGQNEEDAPDPDLTSRQMSLVHKYFWKIREKLKQNQSVSAEDLPPQDIIDLKRYFTRGYGLWGDGRNQDTTRPGRDDEYDWRIVGKLLWEYVGEHLYPDLFSSKKKGIHIPWKGREGEPRDRNTPMCRRGFQNTCSLSNDVSRLEADALITAADIDISQRRPSATYVFYTSESPYKTKSTEFRRVNDIMYSYWRGSEFLSPYAAWIYYDPNVRSKVQTRDYSLGKTKMATILVSHCYTVNDRLSYVYELKKYMDVDVYGGCSRENLRCHWNPAVCHPKLRFKYRFYLAFENANCRDYMTEKLFDNALTNEMVPVVLGAHPSDYRALAPKKSFILAEDFKSPKDLAAYLTSLAENSAAYNEYFSWKGTGELISNHELNCLCSLLWYAEVVPIPLRERSSFWHFQGENKPGDPTCLEKNRWYWSRLNGESFYLNDR